MVPSICVTTTHKAVANPCDAKKPYRCLILHHAEGDPSDPSCSLDRASSACSATICRNVATQPLELPSEAATAENPPVLTSPAHGSVVPEVVEAARHLLTLLIAAPLPPSMPPAAPRTGPTVSTAQGYSPARIAVDHGRGTPRGVGSSFWLHDNSAISSVITNLHIPAGFPVESLARSDRSTAGVAAAV